MELQRLNILHLIAAKVWGGGESCALSMCKAQREEGHRVFVIFDSAAAAFAERFSPFSETSILPLCYPKALYSVFVLRRYLTRNKIHVIHTHTGKVISLAVLARTHLSTKLMVFRHNVLPNKRDLLHRILYRRIDAFLCVSKAVYDVQVQTTAHDVQNRFYQIYNGIDTTQYEWCCHSIRPICSDMLILGYAGRIEENKGLSTLLEAMVHLRNENVVLRIAGASSGDYAKQLQQFCQMHGLDEKRVQWCGFQKDMASFYDAIDVLVLPSYVPEAFGLTMCEAMYCGCTVIAAGHGAPREIVEDGESGYIIAPYSAEDIVSRVKELIVHPHHIMYMGACAHKRIVQYFTMDIWKMRMAQIYADFFI